MKEEQKIKLLRNGTRGYCQRNGEKRISIPDYVMHSVMARDKVCVYCNNSFGNTRSGMATWEHISGIVKDADVDNIALCCGSCNSSRRDKELADWFETAPRCRKEGISKNSIESDVIKNYLKIKIN